MCAEIACGWVMCEGLAFAWRFGLVKCLFLVCGGRHVVLSVGALGVQVWAGAGCGLWPFGVLCGVVQSEAVFGRILYLLCLEVL